MAGPAVPPGFELEDRGNFDPLKKLLAAGVEPTNGFRTPEDIARLKREGYTPASDSDHLRGDAVDLTPGKSGWSLARLQAAAQHQFGPDASVEIHNGTHVHVSLKGWGQAPGTPGSRYSGLPDMPQGFTLEQRGALNASDLTATGPAHDGDTLKLSNGQNGRLFGADAYEMNQQGRNSANALVPLGQEGRDFMQSHGVGLPAFPVGPSSYGRPVVSLGNPGNDPAQALLRNGLGLAAPEYLKGSPQFGPYMEAERLARLNRLGGFQTNAETPSQFRHKDGPWKGAEPGVYGQNAEAVFADEPTPFQGLREDITKGYIDLAGKAKTGAELVAYAKANGFSIDPDAAAKFIKQRDVAGGYNHVVQYDHLPKPLINPGDGAVGAGLRGLADPVNFGDELGGVIAALGAPVNGGPRETVFNSDRRFADIVGNNIDQERAILGHDEMAHPYVRMGGQLVSGLAIPGFGVEGVGAKAGEAAIARGLTDYAASQAARKAVAQRLAVVGAAEGGLMGEGAGEGNPLQRLPSAALGAAGGAVLAPVLGEVANAAAPYVRRGLNALRESAPSRFRNTTALGDGVVPAPGEPAPQGSPYISPEMLQRVNGGAAMENGAAHVHVVPGQPPASNGQPSISPDMLERIGGGFSASSDPVRLAAMPAEEAPSIASDPIRARDYLNVGDLLPIPDGFVLEGPSLGRTPRMGEQATPEQIAAAARSVNPADVTPLPRATVDTLEEAQRANPGRFAELQAPNETDALPKINVGQGDNLFAKPRIRRDVYDITKMLRKWGGVQDQNGELSHLGITNAPRDNLPFGRNEQFLGRLINDKGMTLDQAGERLWEAGYFKERPTTSEVIDALHQEHLGNSIYHPEDLAAVDEFHGLQDQRLAIEQAQHEGSPLVEERGAPATEADMAANSPPATAYEDLATVGGKAANINLSKIETSDDIGRLLNTTEHKFGGFDAARRGQQSNAETAALADELHMTADDLLRRRNGQALNAEQALQARRILAKSGEELVKLAKKLKDGENGDLNVAAFRMAMVRHAAIQEQVTGATAEAGRTLQQFKMAARAKDHRERILKAVIEGAGGKQSIEDAADAILTLQREPGALNRFALDASKPTWKDKLVELWYNSLLSGPQTHAVNILSNSITAAGQLPEHAAAAAIGAARSVGRKARGLAPDDRVLFSEIGPRAVGLLQGAREGVKSFQHTLLTGDVPDFVTKVESAKQEAIGGTAGKIVRVPTRLLSAEDEFFKATARRMEIAGSAVRQARSEGLRGDALKSRINELTRNPTDAMVAKADDYARYLTYQRPLGPAMQKVQGIIQDHPWLKLFVPFIRTPTNLLKYAVERSPAAPLLKEVRQDLKAGGSRRDLALAKMALGTGLGMMVAEWVGDGHITGGGPADQNAKRLLYTQGWQPYSIKVGGTYYSYKRLDPLSTTLGVVADMVDLQSAMTEGQRQKMVPLVIASVMQNLENKTWLSGLSEVFNVIEDPNRNAKHFAERLAGSVAVPAFVAQTARTIDPVRRETDSESIMQGSVDSVKSRIPGLSQTLLPQRDVFGEPVTGEGGVGPDLISPIWTSTAKSDPVAQAVRDSGATIGPVSRDVKGGRLPDAQFNLYQSYAGQLTRQYVGAVVKSPNWKAMQGADRKKAIEDARDRARQDARSALFQVQGS